MSTAAGDGAHRYWRALDGLRGAALLAVMSFHFGMPGARGGWLGVDVFFVLSGFVVANNLRRTALTPSTYGRFLVRRAARLYPALVALLLLVLLHDALDSGGLTAPSLRSALAAAAQVYNLAQMRWTLEGGGFTPLWSLGIEWQFYLLAPIAVAALMRASGRRRVAAAALIGFAAMMARVLALAAGLNPTEVYLATWFRLDGLLLGITASLAYDRVGRSLSCALRRVSTATLVALACLMPLVPSWFVWQRPSLAVVVPIVNLATFALVLAVASGSLADWPQRILESAPLTWLGDRSYSIYLWHYFAGVVLVGDGTERWQGPLLFTLQMSVSLALGAFSYLLVERPARTRLNRWIAGCWPVNSPVT